MNFKEFFTISTWWGKLLGAFFGFLSAGPTGAIFGILVGNIFDRGLANHFSNPLLLYLTEKRSNVQTTFFEATFSIMGYLAKADGRVTEEELNMARSIMNEMHLGQQQKILAMRLFNEGKGAHFDLMGVLSRLRRACNDNRDLLKVFIDIQYQAAQIDGLTTRKIQTLDIIFSHLGFMPFHQQYRFYEDFGSAHKQQETHQSSSDSYSSYSKDNYKPSKSNLDYAYALMEVSPSASKQEVKRAYRRLLSRNHPDKLIAKGLPQEMIKVANEKTQKIVKAYELICESKGW
ncbi:co-chaperone DjlA [Legionella lytica]|uniref:Co-chaperone protein DjlA n=1 Tax=Legionella lytica TaxID=96232 RepID=A0ABY4YAN4_9GAMM|nr:co-chaperone DjlA [Legionella lytica]USQ14554.1 co-chaperone DjlA [Legionella lytica]